MSINRTRLAFYKDTLAKRPVGQMDVPYPAPEVFGARFGNTVYQFDLKKHPDTGEICYIAQQTSGEKSAEEKSKT